MLRYLIWMLWSGLATIVPAAAQHVTPQVIKLDCNAGHRIQGHLETQTRARPLVIIIAGTCSESLIVRRHDVEIRGAAGDTRSTSLNGTISIYGSTLVQIRDLTIQNSNGSAYGITAEAGSSVEMTNVLVKGHARGAMAVLRNSVVDAKQSTFTAGDTAEGTIIVADGASLLMHQSTVVGNRSESGLGPTIGLYRRAGLRLFARNIIRHNGATADPWTGAAVVALDGSNARVQHTPGNTITGNIVVSDQSSADVRDARITGNLLVQENSLFEQRDTTPITGDVIIARRGLMDIRTTISGSVTCSGEGAVFGTGTARVTLVGCPVL